MPWLVAVFSFIYISLQQSIKLHFTTCERQSVYTPSGLRCGIGSLRRDSHTRGGRSWVQTAGPSASSAALQAVTAALAERPSRYGRPCLGGDCGCNLKLREAGLAIYRALLHRDSLFWQGNSWSVNVPGRYVCGRYNSLQRGVAGVVRFQREV